MRCGNFPVTKESLTESYNNEKQLSFVKGEELSMKHQHLFQLLILPILLFNPIGTSKHVRTDPQPSITVTVEYTDVSIGNTVMVSVNLNNVPATGYGSAEFTCTYNMNLVQAGNITASNLFGANPITAINGPENGKFILAIAGNQGSKAVTSGLAFKFSAKALQAGQVTVTCSARVSEGMHLTQLSSAATSFNILGDPSSSACDKAAFIAHITTPPGTIMSAGQTFTKTWRITNIGTCTWTQSYQIIFFSGEKMNAPSTVSLPTTISPGQTMDFSIQMTAPSIPGSYQGYWKLRNANSTIFGAGPQANEPWAVDINVVTGSTPSTIHSSTPTFVVPTQTPSASITPSGPTPNYEVKYDFVSTACAANWYNGVIQNPCNGIDGDPNGFVLTHSAPKLEDGTTSTRPGLLMVPQNINNGYIQGFYPAIKVQSDSRFRSTIGCEFEATDCHVVFRLDYVISGSINIQTFWAFIEKYDGRPYTVDLDLSPLAGQDVRFILTVLSAGPAAGDRALWINPIFYQAFPVKSPTPSSTPTLTATLTNTPTVYSTILTTTATEGPGIISITGKALASKPVMISLYSMEDNSLLTSIPVDINGNFVLTVGAGAYSIGAKADGYLSARSPLTQSSGDVQLMISLPPGDVDSNNVIDQFDALTVGMNYNDSLPHQADLNNDSVINVLDLELLALHYQSSGPIAWQ
jgi:hypothetical protein